MDTYTDGVNVRNVASEGLSAQAIPNIPEFGGGIAGTRYKRPGIRAEGQTHHVICVACKNGGLLASLDIPQCTGKKVIELAIV